MGGEADSADDLRRTVRAHHEHGADLIKVMATGGLMTDGSAPAEPQYTTAQMSLIVEEAGRAGKPVAAHAHSVEGIHRAVEAGASTIEHCSFVNASMGAQFSESLAMRMAEQGTFVCPTVNVNNSYFAKLTGIPFGAYVKTMREMGVRVIAGTDAGVHRTLHDQYVGGLENLVALGLRPPDVLEMATTEAAAALGLDTVTGRLAPGYEADLIVVAGDPQADIGALHQLRRVIARGRDFVPDSGRLGSQARKLLDTETLTARSPTSTEVYFSVTRWPVTCNVNRRHRGAARIAVVH
jgi:imidazolonepropionase-like amidohydrolase